MKNFLKILFTFFILLFISSPAFAADVYRVCDDVTNEHLYTTSPDEKAALLSSGWQDEGTGWVSPDTGDGIYRVCAPDGSHLYTASMDEVNGLAASGWTVDFGGTPTFYSGGSTPVYRFYNPEDGDHQWTSTQVEIDNLTNAGWNNEGVAFNAQSDGNVIFREFSTAGNPETDKRNQIVNQAGTYLGFDGTTFQNRMGIPGLAWCAAFVCTVFQDCGFNYAIPMSCLADDFQAWGMHEGRWHDVNSDYIPQPGDIIVYDYNRNNSADHVGIVQSATGTRAFTSIEGNVGSPRLVRLMNYPTYVSGYVSPVY